MLILYIYIPINLYIHWYTLSLSHHVPYLAKVLWSQIFHQLSLGGKVAFNARSLSQNDPVAATELMGGKPED